jgi:hypothetical protein
MPLGLILSNSSKWVVTQNPSEAKKKLQARLQKDIEVYLASGKKITIIPAQTFSNNLGADFIQRQDIARKRKDFKETRSKLRRTVT